MSPTSTGMASRICIKYLKEKLAPSFWQSVSSFGLRPKPLRHIAKKLVELNTRYLYTKRCLLLCFFSRTTFSASSSWLLSYRLWLSRFLDLFLPPIIIKWFLEDIVTRYGPNSCSHRKVDKSCWPCTAESGPQPNSQFETAHIWIFRATNHTSSFLFQTKIQKVADEVERVRKSNRNG